jgi:hypothetical protein
MTQGQVLEKQIAAASKWRDRQADRQKQGFEHPPDYQWQAA